MSTEYYVRGGGQISGPFDAPMLKQLVQQGTLTATHEISGDQITWNKASRYPKLFPPAPIAAPTVSAPPPPAAPAAAPHAPPAPPIQPATPPLGYYAPRTDRVNFSIRRRTVIPLCIVAGLMLLLSAALIARSIAGSNAPHEPADLALVFAGIGAFLLLTVTAFILWLVWLYGAHRDLQAITGGAYSIPPGMAVGFSCIPFFDAFWIVYMPFRLASEINRHLAPRGIPTIPVPAIIICQILSLLFALFLPGMTVAMYALTTIFIQRGLNRLGAAGTQST